MPIGSENVEVSIEIVIEKQHAEGKAEQARAADRRASALQRFIDKESVTLVMIETEHLVRKLSDEQMGPAGAIVISSVNAHSVRVLGV